MAIANGILCRVVFHSISGLPEDDFMNDFVFDGDAASAVARASVASNLEDFYNTDYGAGEEIANYMSNEIVRGAAVHEFVFYNLAGVVGAGPIGAPVATEMWTLGAGAVSAPLPAEVACCLSFRASIAGVAEIDPEPPTGPEGDNHPRARRRGRVYLGPLNGDVLFENVTNKQAEVNPVFAQAVANAAFGLWDTSGPGGSGNWCVWSRKDSVLRPVEAAYVDNAFDTMRKRGRAQTGRINAF